MIQLELTKTSFTRAFLIIIILNCVLVSPLWYIFQYQRLLFINIDFLKLLIIAIAISFPIVLFNTLYFVQTNYYKRKVTDDKNEEDDDFLTLVTAASLNCFIVLYMPCILSFFVPHNLRIAISVSIFTQVGFSSYFFGYNKARNKESLRINQSTSQQQ